VGAIANAGDFSDLVDKGQATVTWTFSIPVKDATTSALLFSQLVLQGDLEGRDRLGNKSSDDANLTPVRLNVFWLSGERMLRDMDFRPTGSADGYEGFFWGTGASMLGLPYAYAPVPLYTFRVWRCSCQGIQYQDDPYCPYEPVMSDWRAWSQDASVSPAFFKNEVGDDVLKDRWVLVVVGAMDEAGNVTPWPSDELGNDTENVTVQSGCYGALQGRTWKRFFAPGASSVIDTTLAVDFRYDNPDTDLGPATIIAYPADANRKILGYFDVSPVTGELISQGDIYIVAELEQEGKVVLSTELDAGGQNSIRVTLPDLVNQVLEPATPFVLGSPSAVVNYVFRAYTVVDYGNGYVLQDTSPANFSFKVVPKSVEQYLKSSGGEQPVKVFERE
jgi:hypothetical protein